MTGITSTIPPEAQVRDLIRAWEGAIQSGDMAGILDRHTDDVLMFDVPEPMQSLGLSAYRQTWELFFATTRRVRLRSSLTTCASLLATT